jgi:hypothetical protein
MKNHEGQTEGLTFGEKIKKTISRKGAKRFQRRKGEDFLSAGLLALGVLWIRARFRSVSSASTAQANALAARLWSRRGDWRPLGADPLNIAAA